MGKMKPTKKQEMEKVPLLIIYKQGEDIHADMPEESLNNVELFGFLKLYIKHYERFVMGKCFSDDD